MILIALAFVKHVFPCGGSIEHVEIAGRGCVLTRTIAQEGSTGWYLDMFG